MLRIWVHRLQDLAWTGLRVFDPQTKERANQKPRVLICDGYGTHETLKILEFCFENNIILCRLPSHTSHKLQPCDVGAFTTLKAAFEEVQIQSVRNISPLRITLQGERRSQRGTLLPRGPQVVCFRSIQTDYSELNRSSPLN